MKKIIFTGACFLTGNIFANSFVDDSRFELTARNFYFDRNFIEQSSVPAAKDWAQGFILNGSSGYTSGSIQFGVDVLATAGFKLYSDSNYSSTGLLPRDSLTNEPVSSYGEIGLTGKVRYSESEIKLGTLQPNNPVLMASVARLLPQTYRGVSLQSKEINNLDFQAAYLDEVNHRDSTNYEKIKINGVNGRFKTTETSGLYYVGGHYSAIKDTKISAFYLDVNDLYSQYELGLNHDLKINDKLSFNSDLRFYRSREDGQAKAGLVDNDLINANFSIKYDDHKLSFGALSHHGQTAFPYLSGGETSLFLTTWPADFLNAKEQAYSMRYDADLKKVLPGLRFMTRYTYGNNIYAPNLGGDNLKEWEIDYELGYKFQVGLLKDLNVGLRYAVYRNNMLPTADIRAANESRVNIDYTWRF